jgi:selenocysteine lyase/cysteine desulfurase
MRRLQIGSSTRASFAVHNSVEDIDRLMDGLESVRRVMQL